MPPDPTPADRTPDTSLRGQAQAALQRAKAATPGPWQVVEEPYDDGDDIAQRTIHTARDHPQLKCPAPVVGWWMAVRPFRKKHPS